MGYSSCRRIFDRNLPQKYAVGVYIWLAYSLLKTGICKGICKITLELELKLILFAVKKANPLILLMYLNVWAVSLGSTALQSPTL